MEFGFLWTTRRKLFLFAMLLSIGAVCQCQECGLDFHMKSPSLMMVAGDNGSVLCDAMCYDSDVPVEVVWKDERGREIEAIPNSVFAVPYYRGLLNRLIFLGASTERAGYYVCSVTRQGEQLEQKSINVLVFGNNHANVYRFPKPTGPRRGDQIPPDDLQYRPVRSVGEFQSLNQKQEAFAPNVPAHDTIDGHSGAPKNTDKQLNVNLADSLSAEDADKVGQLGVGISANVDNVVTSDFELQVKDKDKIFSSWGMSNDIGELSEDTDRVRRQTGDKQSTYDPLSSNTPTGTMRSVRSTTTHTTNSVYTTSPPGSPQQSQASQNTVTSTELPGTSFQTHGSSKADKDKIVTRATTTRQDSPQTTTDASESDDGKNENTTATARQGSSETDGQSQGKEDKHAGKTTPTTPCEQDAFGKHGLLAFCIALAVAFLLFYSILMIIIMPKILRKRGNRDESEVEGGGAYRKKVSTIDEMAPLTLISDDTVTSVKEDENKKTSDVDKTTDSDTSKDEDNKKDLEQQGANANVSTFLLRQASEKNGGEKKESRKSEEKDEEKKNAEDNAKKEPEATDQSEKAKDGSDQSEKKPEPEPGTSQSGIGNLDSLLVSFAKSDPPALDTDKATTDETNVSESSNQNKAKTDIDGGNDDLPPPPPPPEEQNKENIDV